MPECQKCATLLTDDELDDHMARYHPVKTERQLLAEMVAEVRSIKHLLIAWSLVVLAVGFVMWMASQDSGY